MASTQASKSTTLPYCYKSLGSSFHTEITNWRCELISAAKSAGPKVKPVSRLELSLNDRDFGRASTVLKLDLGIELSSIREGACYIQMAAFRMQNCQLNR